ncbi:MAG: hypothetical protein ACJ771_10875 [Chloroflexota bacterium]
MPHSLRYALPLVALLVAATLGTAPVIAASDGIWVSRSYVRSLPASGPAWTALLNVANQATVPGNATLIDQDSTHSRNTMATALVALRLGSNTMRAHVRDAIKRVKGTEASSSLQDNRLLQLGRNLPGYVIAADLIQLSRFDPTFDSSFRSWISALRNRVFNGTFRTLANGDAHDPGNWGAYGGAARAAISAYLGDTTDLARSAAAMRSFTSGVYDGRWYFRPTVHDMSWECGYPNTAKYVPINSACTRNGHNLDGIMPLDMARGGGYRWPPTYTSYPRENLTGRVIEAQILYRAGYTTVFRWGSSALARVTNSLRRLDALDGRWFEPDALAHRIIATQLGITGWGLASRARGRAVSGVDWTFR